jgi:hypothetical protein
MPLPEFDAQGLLPPGLHDATLAEVRERFGRFQVSDCRLKLCQQLEAFLQDVRSSTLIEAVIVDGSFVTAKDEPGDIDVILVLSSNHDWSERLRPFEYNLLSKKQVRKRFGFDLFVASQGSQTLQASVVFFEQVKNVPGAIKGLVRVRP